MSLLRAIILGIVQGTTEFLPVSSSGHLVLVPWLLQWPEPGLLFDTMVHWGTLIAVLAYFRADLWALAGAWLASLRDRSLNPDPNRRLAWLVLVGSVPAGLAGTLFGGFFESLFGRPPVVAALLLVTGLVLVTSEQWHGRHTGEAGGLERSGAGEGSFPPASPLPTLAGALFIGLAQGLAIAPGISRSGATIAAGLLVGLGRQESARFSFLLAAPAVFGAGLLQLVGLMQSGTAYAQASTLLAGLVVAAVVGYLAIRVLLGYLQRHTLYLFAGYCWLLGLLGLAVYWFRL